jgi:FKBP-type peptidyl-prolyl cis-trans isomerase SlyD
MNEVKDGDIIEVSYIGRVGEEVFDTTDEDVAREEGVYKEGMIYNPITVVLGAGHLIKGFEEDLLEKDIGSEEKVEIAPEKGFGTYNGDLKVLTPISKFKEKPVPGMQVMIDGRVGIVEKVIGRRAMVDFNPPLAGKTISYEYKILRKITDPSEQIKGIIKLYINKEMDADVVDDKAFIYIDYESSLDQKWILFRKKLAEDILKYVGVEEVSYIEKYLKEGKEEMEGVEK